MLGVVRESSCAVACIYVQTDGGVSTGCRLVEEMSCAMERAFI